MVKGCSRPLLFPNGHNAGLRDRLIRNRVHVSNAISGHAAQFGITAAKGTAHLDQQLDRAQADVSDLARKLFAAQGEE